MTVELHHTEVRKILSLCNRQISLYYQQLDYWNKFDSDYANRQKEKIMMEITYIRNLKTIFERNGRK